jgi:hypothetical protein
MVEQAAVNRTVVGSSPTRAANWKQRHESTNETVWAFPRFPNLYIAEWTIWKVAVTLNHGDVGSTPTSAANLNCGRSLTICSDHWEVRKQVKRLDFESSV